MKANRLSKDDSGADSSDAIIILALVLGVLLVMLYMGRSLSGWFAEISNSFANWLSGLTLGGLFPGGPIGQPPLDPKIIFGNKTGTSDAINMTDDLLKSIFEQNNFYLTSDAETSNVYDAYLVYNETLVSDNQTKQIRRWSVVPHEERSALAEMIDREKFTGPIKIPDELLKRMEELREGRTIIIKGNEYTGDIGSRMKDPTQGYGFSIEIVKLGTVTTSES